jgi:hypothetical protein
MILSDASIFSKSQDPSSPSDDGEYDDKTDGYSAFDGGGVFCATGVLIL